jgi:hypothetical protein
VLRLSIRIVDGSWDPTIRKRCNASRVAIALGLGVLLLSTSRSAPRVSGSYHLDRRSSDDIDRAIEKAVSKTNFVVRLIARARLHETNPLIEHLIVDFLDTRVSIRNDRSRPMIVPLSGTPVKWVRDDGETFEVRATLQDGMLTIVYVAEDGTRANTYTPTADGRGMMMHVTVSSSHLPQPLQYKLAFVRD